MKRRVALHKKLTRALAGAGAGIQLGTDKGKPLVVPGPSALEELRLLVDAGLTPYRAIRAGTRDAAAYLNTPKTFGTVAVGARADLILLEANPLEDVANVARRAGVMVRGRWMPESLLRRMLDAPTATNASLLLRERSPHTRGRAHGQRVRRNIARNHGARAGLRSLPDAHGRNEHGIAAE
jgi:adenine deaminase